MEIVKEENKLVQHIRRGFAVSLFDVCKELMGDYRDLSGGYDRLTDKNRDFLVSFLEGRIANWKATIDGEAGYDNAVYQLVLETLKCTKSSSHTLVCKYCNNLFVANKRDALFCSQACRNYDLIQNKMAPFACGKDMDNV